MSGVTDPATIAAIATAPGRGGVGVIRISGRKSLTIAESICGTALTPRAAHYRKFRNNNGELIDDGLALFFPGPNSFTGEDVVELQGHGGPVILAMLLQTILGLGARQARPGEFSERAFLNDKIDLVQAEAIADLIDAQTQTAARQAQASLQGEFSQAIDQLVISMIELRKYVEASIDFPEEEIDFLAEGKVLQSLTNLLDEAQQLRSNAKQGSIIRNGATVVLAGLPNAGKSSLMNRLARNDIAIVTDLPGTTRDIVKEAIELGGVAIYLTDTAGLRETEDIIEAEGVKRAHHAIANADLALHIIDDTQKDTRQIAPDFNGPVITVRNKLDLSGGSIGADPSNPNTIGISTKTGEGLDALETAILSALGVNQEGQTLFSARERHLAALDLAIETLGTASDQFRLSGAGELLAEDLRLAHDQLGEITGKMTSDELLGEIFSNFCIGK